MSATDVFRSTSPVFNSVLARAVSSKSLVVSFKFTSVACTQHTDGYFQAITIALQTPTAKRHDYSSPRAVFLTRQKVKKRPTLRVNLMTMIHQRCLVELAPRVKSRPNLLLLP